MSFFQLDPDSIVARVKASDGPACVPTFVQSLFRGMIGFTVVSIAGFTPWVAAGNWFYKNPGELVMYSTCAAVFIGLSGLMLHPLIIGPGSLKRFYIFFSIAFLAYSIAWIAGWMGLHGQHTHLRSAVGLLAGTVVMGAMFAIAFEAWNRVFVIIAALFLLNSLGYFVGGWIEGALAQRQLYILGGVILTGPKLTIFMKAMWGVCYGIGLGSGLGIAFFAAQTKARKTLARNNSV